MIIHRIEVEKFRMMENIGFELGEKVTVIAGQNGTMKSTLLGMIGQPFSLVNSELFGEEKTLGGEKFGSQFSDAFKFSPIHDVAGTHKWKLILDKKVYPKEVYEAVSIVRDKAKGDIRIWSAEGRSKDMGYIQLPVIFLSLKRLVPVGEEKKVTHNPIALSENEQEFFQKYHSQILLLSDALTSVELIESSNKNTLGAVTAQYDGLTNSAGQDNVGKVLSAILSFRRLKEKYPDAYQGGILLIDELDATMYPAAQVEFVKALYRFASDYNLQIIFTTHSEAVIDTVLKKEYISSTKIVFLDRLDNAIKLHENLSTREILANLSVIPLPDIILSDHVKIYSEDEEARIFIKGILPRGYTNQVKIMDVSVGGDELINLAKKCKIPEFLQNIVILDGDKNYPSALKNFVSLPGSGNSPEKLFFSFLKELPESDAFWSQSPAGYRKQACFRGYETSEPIDRKDYKRWFNNQKKYWGRGCKKLLTRWMADNQDDVNTFRKIFDTTLKRVLEGRLSI